jgi:thioesterase domain-containing protein/acyl carrier protein
MRPAKSETLEADLADLFCELLGRQMTHLDVDFFEEGGHSILAIQLLARVQERFGIEISVAEFMSAAEDGAGNAVASINGLAYAIRQGPRRPPATVTQLRSGGTDAPLVLLHPAGGEISPYRKLWTVLETDCDIYAVQASLTRPDELAGLVAEYRERLAAVAGNRALHVLGWSFGGILAHELACQAKEAGQPLGSLVVLDGYPADASGLGTSSDAALVCEAAGGFGVDVQAPGTSAAASVDDVAGQIAWQLGVPLPVVRQRLELYLADLRCWYRHRPRVYEGDLLLVQAAREAPHPLDEGLSLWRQACAGNVNVRRMDTTHHGLLEAPHVYAVATYVDELISA